MQISTLCVHSLTGGNIAGMVNETHHMHLIPVFMWPYVTAWRFLCFLQFSAVYPEMVDGVIVLDVFGFVPTDLVLYHYLLSLREKWSNSWRMWEMKTRNHFIKLPLWAAPVCGSDFHTSHFVAEKNTPNDEAGDGWDAAVWKKVRREEKSLHLWTGSGEVWLYFMAYSSEVKQASCSC